MSWWTPERQRYALNSLISNAGLSSIGAAALVSRWMNVEAPQGPGSRGGYMGRAWGIAQWLGARLTPIDGNSSFDDQLAYVAQELNSTEARAGNLLRSASSIQEAARAATAYERASGWNPSSNTDNYTARTVAGIPAVHSLLGSDVYQGTSAGANDGTSALTVAGIGAGTLALIGGGLLLLYLALD